MRTSQVYSTKSILLISVVFLLSGWLASCSTPSVIEPTEPEQAEPVLEVVPAEPVAAQPVVQEISVMAVGDIMLGTDFPHNHLPPAGQNLLADVSEILSAADITFGNYEGTLLSGGEPAKQCRNPQRCYVFRTPPQAVSHLVSAGFDVMSLANNHARDFGDEGRSSTMQTLAQAGIHHSGQEGDIASWEVHGLKVALIAFAPFRGAYNPLKITPAQQWVQELAVTNDIVLVSMHMGAEGEHATRIPFAEEIFHGERRGDVVAFSRAMVDAGADLIIGHGPHVPRAIELYQGRLIAYSLGNFCTYYGINVRGLNGLAPILRARLNRQGEFLGGEIISTRQRRPAGPVPDPRQEAARLIATLTAKDFPDTPLEISPNGLISVLQTGKKR